MTTFTVNPLVQPRREQMLSDRLAKIPMKWPTIQKTQALWIIARVVVARYAAKPNGFT